MEDNQRGGQVVVQMEMKRAGAEGGGCGLWRIDPFTLHQHPTSLPIGYRMFVR